MTSLQLTITPQEGYPEAGVISLYIPESLESTLGKKLEHDKLFIFAVNKLNDNNLYLFENEELKRKTKSIIQVKKFNDGKKNAFVNKEIKLFNSVTELGSLILDDTASPYKIEIKFPKNYTNDMFDDVLFEKHENYCTIIGYINEED